MLKMIKKYLSAFGTLFAIMFFLVMALTVLAQVQHPQQETQAKESRSNLGAVQQDRAIISDQGRTRTDYQESESP